MKAAHLQLARASVLCTFTAAAGLVSPSPALAQAQTPQAQPDQTQAGELQEIVVTAEKRPEKLENVPITVSVVTEKQLDRQNIQTTTDLVRAVPELTENTQGIFQIRSIGTQGYGRSAEQSVSVVLDGVVLARDLTNALYDIDHIEVLSGPQGMLFGPNSNAGVINIVTNAPVLKQYQAIGHIDIGDRDYLHAYVIGNLPLGENAALRLSYHRDTTGDVVFNTLYGLWDYNTDNGVRLRLLWEPLDNLTINLSGDYQKLDSNGVNGVADFAGVLVFTYVPPGTPLAATLAGCGVTPSATNNRECANSLYVPGVATGNTYGRENGGGSLKVDYRFGPGLTLTSITAVRKTLNEDFDVDANFAGEFGDTLPQNYLDRNLVPYWDRTVSEELRLQSPAANPLNFVAGLYYTTTDSHDRFNQAGTFGVPLPPPLEFHRDTNLYIHKYDYAGFGQLNYNFTPAWTAFLGARVTHDHLSDYSVNSFAGAFPAGPYIYTGNTGFFSTFPINTCTLAGGNPDVPGSCPAGTSLTQPATLSKTGVSGRVGVQYRPSSDLMLYATAARGYKGPFINEAASYPILGSQLVIKPEYAIDFELGGKMTLNQSFAVNTSLFYERFDDFQTTIYVPPSATQKVANFIQGNAAYAVSRGVDVSFLGEPFQGLNVNGGIIYDDAHFNAGFLVPCATGPCPALHQLPYAPLWKATLTGEYAKPLNDSLAGFVQAAFSFSSRYPYASAPGFPPSPSRYLTDARLGIRATSGKWDVGVFCRNCFDRFYPLASSPDGLAALDGGVSTTGSVATGQFLTVDAYRIVGVTADVRF